MGKFLKSHKGKILLTVLALLILGLLLYLAFREKGHTPDNVPTATPTASAASDSKEGQQTFAPIPTEAYLPDDVFETPGDSEEPTATQPGTKTAAPTAAKTATATVAKTPTSTPTSTQSATAAPTPTATVSHPTGIRLPIDRF